MFLGKIAKQERKKVKFHKSFYRDRKSTRLNSSH